MTPLTEHPHPHLRVETRGLVRTISLARPEKRNTQTPSLWMALAEQARAVPAEVRVVVLRGDGASFSAGIDTGMFAPGGIPGEEGLADLAAGGTDAIIAGIARYQEGFAAWAECPAVVIAGVQGHAIGAGMQLALAADLRVASHDASFAMRETSLGLVPDLAGTHPLVRLVGYSRALEICVTGRFVDAAEAHAIGLVNVVVPAGALETRTAEVVNGILAAPADALRALKPLLRSAVDADPATQRDRERTAQSGLLLAMLGSPRDRPG